MLSFSISGPETFSRESKEVIQPSRSSRASRKDARSAALGGLGGLGGGINEAIGSIIYRQKKIIS